MRIAGRAGTFLGGSIASWIPGTAAEMGSACTQWGSTWGSTWTAAAIWDEGRAEVLALGDRANTVPSAVMVEDSGRPVVGEAAQQRRRFAPADVATEFKRRFGDPVPLVVGGTSLKADELTGLLLGSVLETVSSRQGGQRTRSS